MSGLTVVALLLLLAGAQASYWLLTPAAHLGASSARIAAVWLQALVGIGGGAWLLWRRRRARGASGIARSQ